MRISVLVMLIVSISHTGFAQQTNHKAAAIQLYKLGKDLMNQGKFSEACPKLAASMRYDPAIGTLLNLALCYEELGKLASAWASYRTAAEMANKQGQRARGQAAKARADKLEPELPRLVVQVPEKYRVPSLVVKRDGMAIDPALFGESMYVDSGLRRVLATAPGYQTFDAVENAIDGKEIVVTIRLLAKPKAKIVKHRKARTSSPDKRGRAKRVTGLVLVGTGLVAAGFGAQLGIEADRLGGQVESKFDTEQHDRGRKASRNMLIAYSMGAAALISGGVLYYLGHRAAGQKRHIAIVPSIEPQSRGVLVHWRF